jgi:hypothetical protein
VRPFFFVPGALDAARTQCDEDDFESFPLWAGVLRSCEEQDRRAQLERNQPREHLEGANP